MTVPWRWVLRARGADPVASRKAERVIGRLDNLAADLHESVIRLEQLAERLEALEDTDDRNGTE